MAEPVAEPAGEDPGDRRRGFGDTFEQSNERDAGAQAGHQKDGQEAVNHL